VSIASSRRPSSELSSRPSAKRIRGRARRFCRGAALFVTLAASARAQRLAYDEFDGSHRDGFAKPGLGEWAIPGSFEQGGALHTVGGNHWRKLATPVAGGVVWYAVTLRMEQPITGYATVAPSPTASGQFSEFGFNSAYGAGDGLWTSSAGIVHDAIAATERQTLLARYDFERKRWSAWAAKGDGLTLLGDDGDVHSKFAPLVHDTALAESTIGWLYISKGSPQILALERVALARSAREALTPVVGAAAATAAVDPALPRADEPPPPAGIAALTAASSPLRAGDRILFFGDSTTWQGGYVDLLARTLERKRPELKVALVKRGINGGKSTDLRDGCHDLYGCTQKPFADEVRDEHATAVVIYVGINDVWHGEKGNPPEVFAAALKTMVTAAQSAGAAVVVATPTLIGELARGRNPFDEKLDRYAALALDVAKSAGAVGVDLRSAFFAALARAQPKPDAAAEPGQGTLTYDGVHMLPAGDDVLANEFSGALVDALAPLPLVPWPKSVTRRPGALRLAGSPADAIARVVAELRPESAELGDEGYRLVIDDAIHVTAAGPQGVAWAVATITQLARIDADSVTLPHVEITDAPDCPFRGLLVDVARQPHSIATLETMV
jgi:lysophospholipase L1-like esterase